MIKKKNLLIALNKIIEEVDEIDEEFIQQLSCLVEIVATKPNLSIDLSYELNKLNRKYQSNNRVNDNKKNKKTVTNQENNVLVDWSSYMYGNNFHSSLFGSYVPKYYLKNNNLKIYDTNFIQLYKDKNNKIHIKYQPDSLKFPISKGFRGSEKWQYLELVINEKDMENIDIDYETIFKLENGTNLLENIIKEDKEKIGYSPKMLKIQLPLGNKINISQNDIEYLKILVDFILNNNNFCSKKILNIMDNEESLNIKDVLYLYNIFNKVGFTNIGLNKYDTYGDENEVVYPYPITPITNSRTVYLNKIENWIVDAEIDDYSKMILIQSDKRFMNNNNVLNLDISNGLYSEYNINSLINFIKESNNNEIYINRLNNLKHKYNIKKR